jgi:hypothetical protein
LVRAGVAVSAVCSSSIASVTVANVGVGDGKMILGVVVMTVSSW